MTATPQHSYARAAARFPVVPVGGPTRSSTTPWDYRLKCTPDDHHGTCDSQYKNKSLASNSSNLPSSDLHDPGKPDCRACCSPANTVGAGGQYLHLIQASTSTLGIQVYKYYLHWAPESVNITYMGQFGSLGLILTIIIG